MTYEHIRDKGRILDRLQRDAALNIYQIGDLDDFFWPHTQWFSGDDNALALLYTGMDTPCLLAFESESKVGGLGRLLAEIVFELPEVIYAHVSPHLVAPLESHFRVESRELHRKMVLEPQHMRMAADEESCGPLGVGELEEIEAFYRSAYPGNWFDPRMLKTGCYEGVRRNGQIAAIAGVHVYSAEYRVAALGNIATAPDMRRGGLARQCTASLCTRLFESVDCIGLNVHADNAAAIACYESLGFRVYADYWELALRAPSQ